MAVNGKTCLKCHKTFTTHANLIKHTNRLKPCIAIDLTDELIVANDIYKCNRCEHIFATNQKLTSHLNRKFPCTLKDPNPEEIELRLLFEELKRKNEQQQLQIEQLESQSNTLNNTTTTNNTANNKNSNNNNNINSHNTTNNITINAYGNEDMSHISESMYKLCFRQYNKSPEQLFSIKHFSKQNPCNHNLYISNMRDAYMMINKRGKWNIANKSVTLEKIYYDLKNDLSDAFDKMQNENTIEGKLVKSYSPFVDEVIEDEMEERFKRDSCDVMACMAYNNRHFPMEIKNQMDKKKKKEIKQQQQQKQQQKQQQQQQQQA